MNMPWTCCEHVMNMLWACHEHVVIMSWTCHRHVVSMQWTCHEHVVNLLWTCYEQVVNMPWTCRKHVMKHVVNMLWTFQTDRQTDRPTDRQTDIVVYREVTLPKHAFYIIPSKIKFLGLRLLMHICNVKLFGNFLGDIFSQKNIYQKQKNFFLRLPI